MTNENQSFKVSHNPPSKILVVDDDAMIREFYKIFLSPAYEIQVVETGEAALDACKSFNPNLILLDVDMPGMNGYDTCRKLREYTTAPIVFATAHQTMEEHLKAFDAGGDDILTKPLVPEILLRKVALAIKHRHTQETLVEEKTSLQSQAKDFLTSIVDNKVLLSFIRNCLNSRSFEDLAQHIVNTMRDYSVEGSTMIRHGGNNTFMTTHGEATALEMAILEKSTTMGQVFQFKRNLVVNHDKISIIVANMPEEKNESNARIRDNMAILADTAETFCDNVDMRKVSMERAESMQIALFETSKTIENIRDKQTRLLMDVRMLLEDLTNKVEGSYSELGTTNQQERTISGAMNESVQQILEVLAEGSKINEQFTSVIITLTGGGKQGDVDLF